MTKVGITIAHEAGPRAPASDRIAALVDALRPFGDAAVFTVDDGLRPALEAQRPGIIFTATGSADGLVSACRSAEVLESLGIPFSGSGLRALAVTASRTRTKHALAAREVPTAAFSVAQDASQLAALARLRFPLALYLDRGVATPPTGVVVESAEELADEARALWASGERELVIERHHSGAVFCCVVVGNEGDRTVLPPVSLHSATSPTRGGLPTIDYIPHGLLEVIETVAIDTCQALDLADLARIDLALSDTGVPHVVAVNPLPDLDADEANPVFLAADAAAMDMAELAQRTLLAAATRSGVTLPDGPRLDEVRRRTPPRGLKLKLRSA